MLQNYTAFLEKIYSLKLVQLLLTHYCVLINLAYPCISLSASSKGMLMFTFSIVDMNFDIFSFSFVLANFCEKRTRGTYTGLDVMGFFILFSIRSPSSTGSLEFEVLGSSSRLALLFSFYTGF